MTVIRLIISAFLVSCLFCFSSAPVFAKSTQDILRDLPQEALTKHVRPRFHKLKVVTKKLDELMLNMCLFPNEQKLFDVQQVFEAIVLAFAGVEHLRFGPMVEAYRFERLNYWPDRKGRGVRALRKLVKAQDETLLEAGALAKKSIAVQGLGALEYILYGKGAELILDSEGEGSYRCRFGAAIAANIHDIASELVNGWGEQQEASQHMLSPGTENATFKNKKEVIQEFYKSLISGFKSIHDLKMNQLLGSRIETAKPRRAAFWRSHLAVKVMKVNVLALDDFIRVSGFEELLPIKPVDLRVHTDRIFKQIYSSFDAFSNDIALVVRERTSRKKFQNVMKQISHLSAGFARQISVAADLPLGFNALDGD